MAKAVASRKTPVGYITVTFHIYKEGKQYVSICSELGTSSCGDTIDEALKNIIEATLLYLNIIEEQGERERIFRERNIKLQSIEPSDGVEIKARYNELVYPYVTKIPVSA